MADEVATAAHFLEVLAQASEHSELSSYARVVQVSRIFSSCTKVCPCVGEVLGLIEKFLPDAKHGAILHCLEKLNKKIDQVRNDIAKTEEMIKWEFVKLSYGEVVNGINQALEFCLAMGKATQKTEKMRYRDRLKEVCANQEVTIALNALFDGIRGTGVFQSSILDAYYDQTGGHRPKISSFAIQLMQLVSGGMVALATCEAMLCGKREAEEMMLNYYATQVKDVQSKTQSVLDKCTTKFEEHMLNDLNIYLDSGRPNKEIPKEMSDFMASKYDWLENFCLVYYNLWGYANHCLSGFNVYSLHRSDKCGIVFYRNKGSALNSNRYNEVEKIIEDEEAKDNNAQRVCDSIKHELEQRGIGCVGCAVIRRCSDLWFVGNFSSRIASVTGSRFTVILILRSYTVTQRLTILPSRLFGRTKMTALALAWQTVAAKAGTSAISNIPWWTRFPLFPNSLIISTLCTP